MHKRHDWSEDTTISKCPKTISEMQYGSRGDNLDNKTQANGGAPCLEAAWLLGQRVANTGSLAVGIKSGKRWQ